MGKWHVDHIKPVLVLILRTQNNKFNVLNYKNLQPLWAEENRKKSDKLLVIV